jgi:hypothetical protein
MSCCGSSDVYNITFTQGDTLSRVLTWTNNAKVPYNLTGYTARMQVREAVASQDFLLELTTENSRIVLGGALGTIALTVASSVTAQLLPGQYVYDLELVSGGGQKTTIVEGNFKVKDQVTR